MSPQRYNPAKHHRRSIRLKGWDYRTPGAYFVTICTHRRRHLFANEAFHAIAANSWRAIPTHPHAQHVVLDAFVVMPDHFHGILIIKPSVEAAEPVVATSGAVPRSIPAVVGNFKSLVARRINNVRRTKGQPVWQRGYYERIIRGEQGLHAVRRYIHNNPIRWQAQRDNVDALIAKMDLIAPPSSHP